MIRDSSNSEVIEAFVLAELDALVAGRFGKRLSLPLRVQRESLRARLRQFARIQAEERRAGWRIHHGEFRFEKEHTVHTGRPAGSRLARPRRHSRGNGTTAHPRLQDLREAKIPRPNPPRECRRKARTFRNSGRRESRLDGWTCNFPSTVRSQSSAGPVNRCLPWSDTFSLPERIEESGIEKLTLDRSRIRLSNVQRGNGGRSRASEASFGLPALCQYDDFADVFLGEDPGPILSENSRSFLMGSQDPQATR